MLLISAAGTNRAWAALQSRYPLVLSASTRDLRA